MSRRARSPLVALARFHAASGARVAMRAAVPLAGAITVAIGLTPSPPGTLRAIVSECAAPRPSTSFIVVTAALAFGLAGWAAPRVATGASGWMRALPASGANRRRALALGIAAAEAPLAIAIAGFSAAGGFRAGRFVALVPLVFGAAYAVLPRRRILTAPIAAAGALASFVNVAIGGALVVAADLVAGGERRVTGSPRRPSGTAASPWRLAVRATATAVPAVWAYAAVPLVAGFLFARNNTLAPELAARASRLSVGAAIVVGLAALADRLAVSRPPWRWARSLPSTSRRRILADAAYLATITLPVVIVAAPFAPAAAACAFLALPAAAVRVAGAMRRPGSGRLGGVSSFVLEGTLGAMAFALTPWAAALPAVATPWLLRIAARDEARLPVSRFSPLAHRTAGDPSSWTGR